MNFIPGEQRARSQAFEGYVAGVSEILTHPGVQQELGPVATQLALLNEGAYLPDISYGRISTPSSVAETDRIAVIPRVPEADEQLLLTAQAQRPTPGSYQKFFDRLIIQGYAPCDAEDFLAEVIAKATDFAIPAAPRSVAITLFDCQNHPESASQLTSRPHIFTNFSAEMDCMVDRAATLCHEFVHAADVEDSVVIPENERTSAIVMELRAYHRQAQILGQLGVDQCDYHPMSPVRTAYGVDTIRRRYTSPSDPYAVTAPLIAELRWAGLGVATGVDC